MSIRNIVGIRLANLCLKLCDKRTQRMIGGAIEYGLRSAARDHAEGREYPPDWRPQ